MAVRYVTAGRTVPLVHLILVTQKLVNVPVSLIRRVALAVSVKMALTILMDPPYSAVKIVIVMLVVPGKVSVKRIPASVIVIPELLAVLAPNHLPLITFPPYINSNTNTRTAINPLGLRFAISLTKAYSLASAAKATLSSVTYRMKYEMN